VQPQVEGRRWSQATETANPFGGELERRGEEGAAEGASLRGKGRYHHLVGSASSVGAEKDEAAALDHHLPAQQGLGGRLRGRDGGRLSQPHELGVGVGKARSCLSSLVDEGVDVGKAVAGSGGGAGLPGLSYEVELALGELGQRAEVGGGMDDHLVALQCWVEVGDDPYPPGIA